MKKAHTKECGDCLYRKIINHTQGLSYCDYLCMTGQPRGCRPGAQCTRRLSRKALEDSLRAHETNLLDAHFDWRAQIVYLVERLRTHKPVNTTDKDEVKR